MVPVIDLPPDVVRALERHETEAHAIGGREMVELDDALALFDPDNPDPFWNRMVQARWPADPGAFDRRLAEAIALFGSRSRRPHIWPSVVSDEPVDLVARLVAAGFVDTGRGIVMARTSLDDVVAPRADGDTAIDVLRGDAPGERIDGAARVLAESFAAHGESDHAVDDRDADDVAAAAEAAATDLARGLADPRLALVVATVAGVPAAAAKVTGGSGFAYLSSVATRPGFRGRGLAAMVTLAALAEARRDGARLAYLGVFEGNQRAQRLYARLGFAIVGAPVPDLLLFDG